MSSFVRIERVGMEHAEAVQRLAADPAVVATTNLPAPYPKNGAVTWIRNLYSAQESGEEHAFAIIDERGRLVGITSLVIGADGKGGAELGYWVGRPYWGRGYATGANGLLLAFGFCELELHRVFARPLVRNRASCRVLEKLGFRHVATQQNPFPRFDPDDQIAFYELKRWQWRLRAG